MFRNGSCRERLEADLGGQRTEFVSLHFYLSMGLGRPLEGLWLIGQGLNVQYKFPLTAAWERTAKGRKGGQEDEEASSSDCNCQGEDSSGDLEILEMCWCVVFKSELK